MHWTSEFELRKLTVAWSRTPTVGVVQDPDMCTFHFLNLTGGDPDDTWNAADYTTVETAFDGFWSGIKSTYLPEIKLASYTWRADGPLFRPHGDELSPTLRITTRAVAGTASGDSALPPQCSMSVTEVIPATFLVSGVGVPGSAPGTGRTQMRKRWGRFYLPSPGIASTTDGRFTAAVCASVSSKVAAMYNGLVAGDLIPVVYSPTTGGAWSLDEVHVDDIVDVIRSRRYVTPLTRAAAPIDAP